MSLALKNSIQETITDMHNWYAQLSFVDLESKLQIFCFLIQEWSTLSNSFVYIPQVIVPLGDIDEVCPYIILFSQNSLG